MWTRPCLARGRGAGAQQSLANAGRGGLPSLSSFGKYARCPCAGADCERSEPGRAGHGRGGMRNLGFARFLGPGTRPSRPPHPPSCHLCAARLPDGCARAAQRRSQKKRPRRHSSPRPARPAAPRHERHHAVVSSTRHRGQHRCGSALVGDAARQRNRGLSRTTNRHSNRQSPSGQLRWTTRSPLGAARLGTRLQEGAGGPGGWRAVRPSCRLDLASRRLSGAAGRGVPLGQLHPARKSLRRRHHARGEQQPQKRRQRCDRRPGAVSDASSRWRSGCAEPAVDFASGPDACRFRRLRWRLAAPEDAGAARPSRGQARPGQGAVALRLARAPSAICGSGSRGRPPMRGLLRSFARRKPEPVERAPGWRQYGQGA